MDHPIDKALVRVIIAEEFGIAPDDVPTADVDKVYFRAKMDELQQRIEDGIKPIDDQET